MYENENKKYAVCGMNQSMGVLRDGQIQAQAAREPTVTEHLQREIDSLHARAAALTAKRDSLKQQGFGDMSVGAYHKRFSLDIYSSF